MTKKVYKEECFSLSQLRIYPGKFNYSYFQKMGCKDDYGSSLKYPIFRGRGEGSGKTIHRGELP